jgi:DnaJ-class molecular chaperone
MSSNPDYLPIPFAEWYETNKKELEAEHALSNKENNTKCDECNGKGYRECDLGHEHECGECYGEGTTDLLFEFASTSYINQRDADKVKYLRYQKEMENAS